MLGTMIKITCLNCIAPNMQSPMFMRTQQITELTPQNVFESRSDHLRKIDKTKQMN